MRGLNLKERALQKSQSSGRESASDFFAPCLAAEWASSLPYLADSLCILKGFEGYQCQPAPSRLISLHNAIVVMNHALL